VQQRKETLAVLLSTLLVLAYRFQRGSDFAQVAVLPLQGNKLRLQFGCLSFTFNYIVFNPPQLIQK
jgi:hypothetical protein